jgi:hypothetical protein
MSPCELKCCITQTQRKQRSRIILHTFYRSETSKMTFSAQYVPSPGPLFSYLPNANQRQNPYSQPW